MRWKFFFSAQYKLLPPYGASFAALWCGFCRLMACVLPPYVIFEAQYKSLLHFSRGGGGVKAVLWTACCCQKLSRKDSIVCSRTIATFCTQTWSNFEKKNEEDFFATFSITSIPNFSHYCQSQCFALNWNEVITIIIKWFPKSAPRTTSGPQD